MHLQRILNILIYLSFVVLANANNLVKKETFIKEPKVKVETVRIVQSSKPSRSSSIFDNSFMPVFLTSNVKASDFTQEMLKSLATNNFIKPSVKLSTPIKQSNKQLANKDTNKKTDSKAIKSENVVTRWSKAGSSNSNFSPVLPINLSKMHFDTTGFIPIVPKQSTRSSSNAKLVKQASKPISRPTVNAKTIPLPKPLKLNDIIPRSSPLSSSLPLPSSSPSQSPSPSPSPSPSLSSKNTSKRKPLIDLNKELNKEIKILPNPSVRAFKSMKSNSKSISSNSLSKLQTNAKSNSVKNAKIVDNRPIASASSTELNSYISRDARKALFKMNTLRYLAKLSPQWSASSLSETYQPSKAGGMLNAYPIGKITIPSDDSYGAGYKKTPEISIELIKEILHKLTKDEVKFNKLYVMGTHRQKEKGDPQYQSSTADVGGYQSDNNDSNYEKGVDNSYQNNDSGYQQDGGSSYQDNGDGHHQMNGYDQPEGAKDGYSQANQGAYSQPENGSEGYTHPENGGDSVYNQPDQVAYSQPDHSQGGNNYQNEDDNSYQGGGDSYNSNSNVEDNSYNGNSNEGDSSYTSNDNSYQSGGDSDQEQGYHLQSLGYDMSQYTNRAYVPSYSINSLASFVHSKFKETAMKKQMGEYQYIDNPYLNNYENYKSMDVNYAQFMPDGQGGRKKCSKNHNGQNGGYANNDVNFDDSYNNYGMPNMKAMVYYNNHNNGNQNRARCKHRL